MAKKRKKHRKSKYNRKRGYTARRKRHYNRKRRGSRKHKRNSAYSAFVKKQWRTHKAHFKRIGFRNASKQIGAAWNRKK